MAVTPFDGVRAVRIPPTASRPNQVTHELPAHLTGWQLPNDWRWGSEGVLHEYRHYQEVVDALGRSLSLVSVPDPAHAAWLWGGPMSVNSVRGAAIFPHLESANRQGLTLEEARSA